MAAIKYYPSSRIKTGLHSRGGSYMLNGKAYVGPYYLTYKGEAFSGTNPVVGSNQLLEVVGTVGGIVQGSSKNTNAYNKVATDNNTSVAASFKRSNIEGTLKQLISYYPIVLDSDYSRGYFTRYFAKRIIDKGYILEISYVDWATMKNGNDPTYQEYETTDMIWQLTGPLKDRRVSQYQVIGGIETTNKRITEMKTKSFIGLVEFIGGDYIKFAKVSK